MQYLKIQNLKKNYNQKKIFENVNIDLKKGEVCAILGKSGSGKTTIFNILAGFESSDAGEIYFKNNILQKGRFDENISYMQQKHLLLPHLTVFQNICLPMKIKKIPKSKAYETAEKALKDFGLLHTKDTLPSELSGGMKQRVSFIRAYLKTKELILLDEPFSSLDNITKFEIYDWFKKIVKNENITVLFITHDIQEAILLSDKIYIMDNNFAQKAKNIKDKNQNLITIENKTETIENFLHTEQFFHYYTKILKILS